MSNKKSVPKKEDRCQEGIEQKEVISLRLSTMIDTTGLLILPQAWLKLRSEQFTSATAAPVIGHAPRGILTNQKYLMRFAEIRKSGRVGEVRLHEPADIMSITLAESYTQQKRWYKALVCFTPDSQRSKGLPASKMLYFYANTWILNQLMLKAEKADQRAKRTE